MTSTENANRFFRCEIPGLTIPDLILDLFNLTSHVRDLVIDPIKLLSTSLGPLGLLTPDEPQDQAYDRYERYYQDLH
jgi:hypothetical protein